MVAPATRVVVRTSFCWHSRHLPDECPSTTCIVAAGVPLKPMLAKICEGIPDAIAQLRDHGGRFLAEFKYDGVRAQIHLLEDGSVSGPPMPPAH